MVKIVNPDGSISTESYTILKTSDKAGMVVLCDKSGRSIKVHKQRIIGETDSTIIPCPVCKKQYKLINNRIVCSEHGVCDFDKHRKIKSQRGKPMKEEKVTKQNEQFVVATVNIEEIKKYGELWAKVCDNFNHPTIGLIAYAILADNPPRKQCFNTYNNTLSKVSKDPIKELKLQEFKDCKLGNPVDFDTEVNQELRAQKLKDSLSERKQLFNICKDLDLEKARQKLKKLGYSLC